MWCYYYYNIYKLNYLLLLIFCLCLFTQPQLPLSYRADGILELQNVAVRSLLQAQNSCPVEFESQNYTIITSQCKGPEYPASSCCRAFKEFACPFADQLNDLTNNCAITMFSYIKTIGKFPDGLFANTCSNSKLGIECPAPPPSQPQPEETDDKSNSHMAIMPSNPSSLSILTGAFLVFLLQML